MGSMAFWSKKKPKEEPLRPWNLPGEIGTLSLPASLSVEWENEETLLASPAGNDSISLRFSCISFTKKGDDSGDIAKPYVRKKAAEDNAPYYEVGEKGVLSFEEPSAEDGQELLFKYWYVGARSTIVIVSATIAATKVADTDVRDLLDSMPRIIASLTIHATHLTADYEGHEVALTEHVVDPIEQATRDFAPSDNEWLKENRRLAACLGVKYGSGGDLTPEELDVVFSRWMNDDEDKEPDLFVANALGAAFGDYLIDSHGFRWVVVTDEAGTDYAVRHQTAEVTAFPPSSIMKRIERNESECFQDLRAGILDVLQRQIEQSD